MAKHTYRLVAVIIVLATLLVFVAPASAAPLEDGAVAAAATTGRISTSASYVNVRSGPSTSNKSVGILRNGATVTILGSVSGQAVNRGNSTWYNIGSGRFVYSGLVTVNKPATLPEEKPAVDKPAATGERWIEVIVSQRKLIAHQGDQVVLTSLVGVGKARTPTVKGTFYIRTKLRSTSMSGPGYNIAYVPYTMYFFRGYAIHGAPWVKQFGGAVSHGCVNVNVADAAWLFNWASVGTRVYIH